MTRSEKDILVLVCILILFIFIPYRIGYLFGFRDVNVRIEQYCDRHMGDYMERFTKDLQEQVNNINRRLSWR